MNKRIRNRSLIVTRIGIFTALAVVGSFITIPSPVSTIALDSTAGYFCALNFGEYEATIVFFLGHIATSIVHGFPLGLLHIPIALGLALQGFIMNKISKISKLLSTFIGIIINTGLVVIALPVLGLAGTIALIPYLAFASAINAFIAYFATKVLRR
jgi:hypothetical protein